MKSDDNPVQAPGGQTPAAERDLLRIMVFSTSLGFGILAAFLCSLRDIENDVSFVFSAWTVIAFVAGAAAGWFFWRFVRSKMAAAASRSPSSSEE